MCKIFFRVAGESSLHKPITHQQKGPHPTQPGLGKRAGKPYGTEWTTTIAFVRYCVTPTHNISQQLSHLANRSKRYTCEKPVLVGATLSSEVPCRIACPQSRSPFRTILVREEVVDYPIAMEYSRAPRGRFPNSKRRENISTRMKIVVDRFVDKRRILFVGAISARLVP